MLLNLGLYFKCSVGQGTQMFIFLPVIVKKSFQLSRLTTESQTLNSFTSEYLGESEGIWGKALIPDPGESRLQATWVQSKPQKPWPWASQYNPQAQVWLGTLTLSPPLPGLAAGSCGSPSDSACQLGSFIFERWHKGEPKCCRPSLFSFTRRGIWSWWTWGNVSTEETFYRATFCK